MGVKYKVFKKNNVSNKNDFELSNNIVILQPQNGEMTERPKVAVC